MSDIKLVMNARGIREYLKSDEVRLELLRRAKKIADAGNSDKGMIYYDADSYVGKNRARADVHTATHRAQQSNKKSPHLLRAIGVASDV